MPRRPAHPAHPPSPPPPDPSADNIQALRSQWKWAAFSQFFHTFAQLFAMPDVSIHDIERDLIYQTSTVLPKIMQRLLYTVSYDRKVSIANWQTALRKQYNKRDPIANPIGPEPQRPSDSIQERDESVPDDAQDELPSPPNHDSTSVGDAAHNEQLTDSHNPSRQPSVKVNDPYTEDPSAPYAESLDWHQLPMLAKLDSMHTLVEWQFQNPLRLRTIMKSDDECASWRIDAIGYDSKSNAYWFIGSDQLWIQRTPPKPPKQLKRKRPAPKRTEKKSSKPTPASASKRVRVDVTPSKQASSSTQAAVEGSGRRSRAAKDQAKLKLDAQARELAQLKQQAELNEKQRRNPPRAQPSRLGTRVSARLRNNPEDEWQPIPDEWLEETLKETPSKSLKTGLESDEESELTQLSDDGGDEPELSSPIKREATNEEEGEESSNETQPHPEGFVEWEMLCSTLYEWEHIAERFAGATHYAEKALYKTLTRDIVPFVTEELREQERKRQLEEALNHRKRSSRIAVRESEREEARLVAKRKQEDEEKMSRARRLEARQQKEEMERVKREQAREQRRKEREMREESRKTSPETVPEVKETNGTNSSKGSTRKEHTKGTTRATKREDWELACEICHQHAINPREDSPVVSCGYCGKWQHIECHDRADRAAGRHGRDWQKTEFYCRQCRASQSNGYSNSSQAASTHPYPNYQQSAPSQPNYIQYPAQYNPRPTGYTNHYGHPSNGAGAYPPAAQYTQSSSSQYPATSSRPISFSHYQPAERSFVPIHKAYGETHPSAQHSAYGQSNHYNQQPYAPPPPVPYKHQVLQPNWNVASAPSASTYTPSHPPISNPHPSSYRPYTTDNREFRPHLTNGAPHGPSYTPPQYAQGQFRHQSSSYQPPLEGS